MPLALQAFSGTTFGIIAVSFDVRIPNVFVFAYFFRARRSPTAAKTHLQKLLVQQKHVLCLMYFSESRAHAVSLFINSNILPINMLYVETVSSLMYDVSRLSVPSNISDLFTKVNKIHTHKTRSSSSGNFYITSSSLSLNQRSFARFGAKLWNSYRDIFRQLPKSAFKKHVHDLLLLIMEAEDNYVETLFFCIKLQILHNLCTRYIVLLDFLKSLILLHTKE